MAETKQQQQMCQKLYGQKMSYRLVHDRFQHIQTVMLLLA